MTSMLPVFLAAGTGDLDSDELGGGMHLGHADQGMGAMHDMNGPMWMPMEPPTFERLIGWHPQPIPLMLIASAVLALLYLWGVLRLSREGHRWPWGRSTAWGLGLVAIVAVNGTGVGGYGMMSFSAHMVQHLVLALVAPALLLLGAPITLLLRALPRQPRQRRSARRALLGFLHSRFMRVVTHPLPATAQFLLSLYAMYFTPIFDWMMGDWLLHYVMLVHFVLSGAWFLYPVIGVDPGPRRSPYLMRLIQLMIMIPFHSFFGIAIMMSPDLIVGFFANPPAGWPDPIADQELAGSLTWAFADIPTLIIVVALIRQWRRADTRQAQRLDRKAAREEDAALAAYNAELAALADRDRG